MLGTSKSVTTLYSDWIGLQWCSSPIRSLLVNSKGSNMKALLFCLPMMLCVSGIAFAQEASFAETVSPEKKKTDRSYFVTVAEYHLDTAVPVTATESEIVKLINERELDPVETIRLSALSDAESQVQFASSVSVITGKITNRDRVSNVWDDREIGTMVRILLATHPRGVIADVSYSTTRLRGEGTDETPPDLAKNVIECSQVFQLGRQYLLGARSADEMTCVVLTVTELP